jgi:hypothetical protein
VPNRILLEAAPVTRRASYGLLFLAVGTVLASGIALPAGAAPQPAFGPSETGCPSFFPAAANGPDVDAGQVGPFGTSQQHMTGMGVAADAEGLTVSLQVQDMRRQAAPGFRWTYWEIFFGIDGQSRGKQLEIYYDALLDDFTWWAGRFNGTFDYKKAVDGTVVTGPGGGVAITVPFGALGLESGIEPGDVLTNFEAESGSFISYIYMRPPDYLSGTYPSGIYTQDWRLDGPDSFVVMPCPGITVEARDLGNARGARLTGGALPAEAGQPISVEQQTQTGWTEVGTGTTGDFGQIFLDVLLPPGTVTLRATVTTRLLGEVNSAPLTVTLTD